MRGHELLLIKWGIVGLIFIGRAVAAANRKQKLKERGLRPPQSAPAPPPIPSPSVMKNNAMTPPKSKSSPDSPWSSSKGPFD